MTVVQRQHFDDEEPDVDELERDALHEEKHAPGHCGRCGLEGHHWSLCPTVNAHIMKRRDDS